MSSDYDRIRELVAEQDDTTPADDDTQQDVAAVIERRGY